MVLLLYTTTNETEATRLLLCTQQQTKQKQWCYTTTFETVAWCTQQQTKQKHGVHNVCTNETEATLLRLLLCKQKQLFTQQQTKQKQHRTQQQTKQKQHCFTTTNETEATPYTTTNETVATPFVVVYGVETFVVVCGVATVSFVVV